MCSLINDHLSKELIALILQYLDEEKYQETARKLEQESRVYFNARQVEKMILDGQWDEVEKYITSFIQPDDSSASMMIFWNIRKQKYLEALEGEDDVVKAVNILGNNFKIFLPHHKDMVEELAKLLIRNDIRQSPQFSNSDDTMKMRLNLVRDLEKLYDKCPSLHNKLQFPKFQKGRLLALINQSLGWQHLHCIDGGREEPEVKTLFADHRCEMLGVDNVTTSTSNQLPSNINALSNPKRKNSSRDQVDETTERQAETEMPAGNELNTPNMTPPSSEARSSPETINPLDDVPKTVVRILKLFQPIMSMDFHPIQETKLLAGTNAGKVMIWELVSGEKLYSDKLEVRDPTIQAGTSRQDRIVPVTLVKWTYDGTLFGVTYSRHVRIYSYTGGRLFKKELEIEAHNGRVNDLEFASSKDELTFITCGEDKTIKVWDAASGELQLTIDAHEAPITFIYPYKGCIFSGSSNGEMKSWEQNSTKCILCMHYPNFQCMGLLHNADKTRFFSRWRDAAGNSYFFEMNDKFGKPKTIYQGLCQPSKGVVNFDIGGNHILVAGDDHQVKFWDVNNAAPMNKIDVKGGLPPCPIIRFSKDGSLLAVVAKNNEINVFANPRGLELFPLLPGGELLPPLPAGAFKKVKVEADVESSGGPRSLTIGQGSRMGVSTKGKERVL